MNLVGSKFIIKKEQGDQDGGSRLSGNQNKKPFLSIITVVYNGEKFLEENKKLSDSKNDQTKMETKILRRQIDAQRPICL